MKKFKLCLCFMAVVVVFSLLSKNSYGQGAGSGFKWGTYEGKNKKTYTCPRWAADTIPGNKAYILFANGSINIATGVNLEEATLTVFQQQGVIPNSYQPTASMTLRAVYDPNNSLPANRVRNAGFVEMTNNMVTKWDIAWSSPIAMQETVPTNSNVKLHISVKTKTGTDPVVTSELTPEYFVTTTVVP